jgi:hypothetical protein
MLGKRLLHFNVGSPSNADLTDALKLSAAVTAAMATNLEKIQILPPDIDKDK